MKSELERRRQQDRSEGQPQSQPEVAPSCVEISDVAAAAGLGLREKGGGEVVLEDLACHN